MSEEKPKNLCQKLAEVVLAIDHVEKAGRNEFQRYAYVKATDIARAVRGELSKRNIYLVTDVIEIRNYEIPAREGVMQAVDVKVQFSFFDGDEPSTLPIVYHSYGTGTDKGDKAVYKAMTGALKYGLRNGFLIPDESDPEADTKTDVETGKASAKAVGDAKIADLKAKKGQKDDHNQTANRVVFVIHPVEANGHYFAVSGYVVEEPMQKFFADVNAQRFKSKFDQSPYWRVPSEYEKDFETLCSKMEIEVQ